MNAGINSPSQALVAIPFKEERSAYVYVLPYSLKYINI